MGAIEWMRPRPNTLHCTKDKRAGLSVRSVHGDVQESEENDKGFISDIE